ncbi:putative aminoglycoside phosphotransferase [subsurface metagenome]
MEDKIRDYLKFRMPKAENLSITNLQTVVGGTSRENIAFEAEWTEEGRKIARSFIIRRDPTASLVETDREMEFRVLQSLESTPVPVPKMYWLERDEKWLERPFVVMEKMPGTPTSARMGLFAPEDPELRAKIANQFVEILANIHAVDWKGFGLAFLGVPEAGTDCACREIDKWEKVIDKDKLEPQPILTEALLWLKNNKPEIEQITLVHGDFKQDNLLFENEKITAFLDWELTHLGDPMEDLGWSCMEWWRQDTHLICGLLEKEEFFRQYENLSGIKVDEQKVFFYQVLGCVKMTAIILTGIRSFSEGRSHDITLGLLGLLVPRLENELAKLLGF